jgi:hypothetical protein
MVSSSSGQRHHAHATAETTITGPRHTGRLPQIHRHFTVTRRSRIWEDQKAKRAAAAPTKTTAPATHALTLFTHRTHRSGVPPPFRRRRRRRREEEPTAAPGKRGGNGDALSVASLNCSRGKGERGILPSSWTARFLWRSPHTSVKTNHIETRHFTCISVQRAMSRTNFKRYPVVFYRTIYSRIDGDVVN